MSLAYIVRHGTARFLGEFLSENDRVYARNTRALVRSDRGVEIAEVLCESTPQALALLQEPTHGVIVRPMTAEDEAELGRLTKKEELAFHKCKDFIRERRLQMDLVDVEHLFGGERLVFYFIAEKRVDFRELGRDLARE